MPSTKPVSIRDAGNFGATAQVDPAGGALVFIDHITAGIRAGRYFSAEAFDLAVAKDDSLNVLVQVPVDTEALFRMSLAASEDSQFELFELTTFSLVGAVLAAVNRNRGSTNTAALILSANPTLIADGNLLVNAILPGGSTVFDDSLFREVAFPEGVYLARFTNIANGPARPLALEFTWLETDTSDE